jgi:4-carboxymuconolactone decarboxylase
MLEAPAGSPSILMTLGRRNALTDDDARAFLEEMHRKRGYTLEMHRVMASADLDWLKKYTAFLETTYTNQRLLDRKTKELLQIVVETALRADVEQIRAHIRIALNEGATPREILEALETVIAPMGALAFRRGLQAWTAETGVDPDAHQSPH